MYPGVGKSGSPAPKPMTGRPAALSSLALASTASVADSAMLPIRAEIRRCWRATALVMAPIVPQAPVRPRGANAVHSWSWWLLHPRSPCPDSGAPAQTGTKTPEGSGSIGRAPVSKTGGWGFESLLPCRTTRQTQVEGGAVTETRATSSSSERRPAGGSGRTPIALFLRQVIAELRKVIWPTRDQLTTYFIVVLFFVLVMISIVSVLDYSFNTLAFKVFG